MNTSIELPRFKSHKEVRAAKIKGYERVWDDRGVCTGWMIHFVGGGHANVGGQWMAEKRPEPGGYFVVYEDGYTSFSPAQAFENGYTRIEGEE